jgi:hypothetical protein
VAKYTTVHPIKAVYLDGVKQPYAFEADTDTGTIRRYVLNKQGNRFVGYQDERGVWQPAPPFMLLGVERYVTAWEEAHGRVDIVWMTPREETVWRIRNMMAKACYVWRGCQMRLDDWRYDAMQFIRRIRGYDCDDD